MLYAKLRQIQHHNSTLLDSKNLLPRGWLFHNSINVSDRKFIQKKTDLLLPL